MRIGLVGATGLVGQTFIQLLDEHRFPLTELRPFASASSVGTEIHVCRNSYPIQTLQKGCFEGLDIVFFGSGDEISKEWAPQSVESGAWAIDNSAAFRLQEDVTLLVPEVNFRPTIGEQPCIIANPNCSTIQLVVLLNALKKFQMSSVRVATYQAVSGAGRDAVRELEKTAHSTSPKDCKPENFRYPIAFNCLPEIGAMDEQGWCSEEQKIRRETKKILNMPKLPVSAFTVRIPTQNAHGEAVWVSFANEVSEKELIETLRSQNGLLFTDPSEGYPSPLFASGTDPVHVGRVRKDLDFPNTWMFWVVADNLRKGAALNALQIASRLLELREGSCID